MTRQGKLIHDGYLPLMVEGAQIRDRREQPRQIRPGMIEHDFSSLLPTLAALRGFSLASFSPRSFDYGRDPFVLYDQWGHILHEWPEDYTPHWVEVMEVSQRFL